jgi:hypothetical protein
MARLTARRTPATSTAGLRRDRVTEVLQNVQDVHRAVLGPVFVLCYQAAADPAVVGVLPASFSRWEHA